MGATQEARDQISSLSKRLHEKTVSSLSPSASNYNQRGDVEKMSRSYSKLSRSALNRIDKTKFTSMDDNLEIVESPNKNRAPSIFDLSIEEEDSFTDCKTDPDDDAITLTHDTKKTAGANLRKTSTQCVMKFPVPLLSRQDLLNVFNIIKANDIHNSGSLTEIVRQIFMSDTIKAIFKIKQDVALLSNHTNEKTDYGVLSLDLSLLCGTKLSQINLDLTKNLQYQIKTIIDDYNGIQSELSVEKDHLLRQVLEHLASSVKKSAPSLSGLSSSLLALTNNVCKSLSFDELVLKFERMEAIPPKSSDTSQTFSRLTETMIQQLIKEDIEAMIKYLKKGAIFTTLSLSVQSSGNQQITSKRIHLRLSKNEDKILTTAMETLGDSVGENSIFQYLPFKR